MREKHIETEELGFDLSSSRSTEKCFPDREEKTVTCGLDPSDEYFMRLAIEQAQLAESIDEVPIGAVAVKDGKVIAAAYNTRETERCATHHAELICIERACKALGGWRLPGVTLYVTLEPCCMCAGAIINARIPRVVYGASDYRFGALGSLCDLSKIPFNHIPSVLPGVLSEECSSILTEYFKKKRGKREQNG